MSWRDWTRQNWAKDPSGVSYPQMRWEGEYIGSPPLHSSSSPSSWLQWMTTSSPTFQRFTFEPTAQTMPEASEPAMWKGFLWTSNIETGTPSEAQTPL